MVRRLKIKPTFRTKFPFLFQRSSLVAMAVLLGLSSFLTIPSQPSYASFPNHEFDRTIGNRTTLEQPFGIATDSQGNVFVSDYRSHVKKLSPAGEFIMQFGRWGANDGQFATNSIRGIAIDSQDNIYVVDSVNHRIQKFNNNGIFISKIGNGISGTGNGQLKNPSRVAVDTQDNLYVTDYGNNRIQKFDSNGTFLWKAGGTAASAVDGQFNQPVNIAIDSTDNVFVADNGNFRIQEFSPNGAYLGKFGQKNTGVTCPAHPSLDSMNGLSFDSSDNLYVSTSSTWCDNVYKFNSSNAYVGRLPIDNHAFRALHIDTSTDKLYAVEGKLYISGVTSWYELQEYDLAGTFIQGFGKGLQDGEFRSQTEMTQDGAGNTYVLDMGNRRIQKFDTSGSHLMTFSAYGAGIGQYRTPYDIAVDANGNIFVTDTEFGASKVLKYDNSGNYLLSFGSSGSGPSQFSTGANMITVGLNGDLYVTDRSSSRMIKQFANDGTFIREIGTYGSSVGFINTPTYLDVSSTGELFVLNSASSGKRVSVFNANGVYQREFSTKFVSPPDSSPSWHGSTGLEIDTYDNIYVIDAVDGGLGVLDTNGRFLRQFGSFGYYKSSNGTSSRNQYLMVAKNNEVYVNGDHDHIQIYGVASIAAPPSAPQNSTATPNGNGKINITWDAPATSNNSPLLRYETEYKPAKIDQWISGPSVAANVLSVEISGLLQDSYDIRVTAVNAAGQSTPATNTNIIITSPYEFKQKVDTRDGGYVHGIAFDSAGKRYESDNENYRVNIYAADGTYESSFGTYGSGAGQFQSPQQLAINSENILYVADTSNDRITMHQLDGTYIGTFGTYGEGDGQMYYPYEIHIDTNDDIYVVNRYSNIQKYDKNGAFLERIATDLTSPTSMVFDETGNLYVANGDYDVDHGIIKYDPLGNRLLKIGSEGESDGQMYEIFGMIINPDGQLVINDTYNYRLQTFTTGGTFVNTFGRGYGTAGEYMIFNEPETIVQSANGDLYIPDGYSPYVQILSHTSSAVPPVISAPSVPQMVTAEVDVPNRINVKWSAPADDGGDPITSYKIETKKSSEGASSWTPAIVDGSAREHVITNVQAGCHDIRVSAGNGYGYGVPTFLGCIAVVDPTPSPNPVPNPPTGTPTPTPALNEEPTAASSPSPDNTTQEESSDPAATEQQSAITISPIEDGSQPGDIIINWQPPTNTDSPPSGYVIEYRDTTTGPNTPWKEATRTNGDRQSVTITLPPGEYDVRVAALMPGEKTTRIILGVAKVSIANPISYGDGPAVVTAPVAPPADNTIRNWIAACSAALLVASLFLIPIFWKRRRKKAQQQANQFPPRRSL